MNECMKTVNVIRFDVLLISDSSMMVQCHCYGFEFQLLLCLARQTIIILEGVILMYCNNDQGNSMVYDTIISVAFILIMSIMR